MASIDPRVYGKVIRRTRLLYSAFGQLVQTAHLRTKFIDYVKISSLLKIGASRNPNYLNILE
ncbi:hypothetical protein L484_016806 [Morus notabilis]|uniref:Uncharacterized protein n=1 Tax=Morus notabilis TaxID=981085 RepID=W9SF14_9ROSA|nr:hypothetical protein L484_016806 [Morus notabilis]